MSSFKERLCLKTIMWCVIEEDIELALWGLISNVKNKRGSQEDCAVEENVSSWGQIRQLYLLVYRQWGRQPLTGTKAYTVTQRLNTGWPSTHTCMHTHTHRHTGCMEVDTQVYRQRCIQAGQQTLRFFDLKDHTKNGIFPETVILQILVLFTFEFLRHQKPSSFLFLFCWFKDVHATFPNMHILLKSCVQH